MKLVFLAALLALSSLLQAPSGSEGATIGVLVGLQQNDLDAPPRGPGGGTLRTVWIPIENPARASDGDVIRVADLLLPRRSGFWRGGLMATCAESGVEGGAVEAWLSDHLWFAPNGRTPTVSLRRREPGDAPERLGGCQALEIRCATVDRNELSWVWPEYFSSNRFRESGCGAHSDASSDFTVRSIDRPDHPLSLAQVLGQPATARLRNAFESARRAYLAEWKDFPPEDVPSFDPTLWRIERLPGEWRVRGWVETDRLYGVGFEYEANLDLSAVTGRDSTDTTALLEMKQATQDVRDLHSGLAGWRLAVTNIELRLMSPSSTRAAARVAIAPNERVIMVEWATGANVQRWSEEARSAAARGPVKARVIR